MPAQSTQTQTQLEPAQFSSANNNNTDRLQTDHEGSWQLGKPSYNNTQTDRHQAQLDWRSTQAAVQTTWSFEQPAADIIDKHVHKYDRPLCHNTRLPVYHTDPQTDRQAGVSHAVRAQWVVW